MACRPRRVTRGYAKCRNGSNSSLGPPSQYSTTTGMSRCTANWQQFLSQRSVGWVAITSATVQCSANPKPCASIRSMQRCTWPADSSHGSHHSHPSGWLPRHTCPISSRKGTTRSLSGMPVQCGQGPNSLHNQACWS